MTSVRLQLLRRQLLSSALTPSLQYEAAAFRLHALTESMCLFSPMIVGLKCSLHLSSPPLLPISYGMCHLRQSSYVLLGVIIDEKKRHCQGESTLFAPFFQEMRQKPLLISPFFFAKISPLLLWKTCEKKVYNFTSVHRIESFSSTMLSTAVNNSVDNRNMCRPKNF